jgi:hypothetical protein
MALCRIPIGASWGIWDPRWWGHLAPMGPYRPPYGGIDGVCGTSGWQGLFHVPDIIMECGTRINEVELRGSAIILPA